MAKKVKIATNFGDITVELLPEKAPKTVENFVKLAKSKFYDGKIFHRIIRGFMMQGGCPQGTGTGGPGYTIKDEFNDTKHVLGTLSMARTSAPNSAGCQFYICFAAATHLDGQYTAFGKVVDGIKVVQEIEKVPVGANDRPKSEVKLVTMTVVEE
ncbi:MAG: cyclophilin type peptidyl-prolyl cis-trans [Planctomycetota bacterium]|nr:MAG: cyclophilin type peptidyl-prolyl cis-trans [Planctomycetota bacterium]